VVTCRRLPVLVQALGPLRRGGLPPRRRFGAVQRGADAWSMGRRATASSRRQYFSEKVWQKKQLLYPREGLVRMSLLSPTSTAQRRLI
jgi:hypothetical protein